MVLKALSSVFLKKSRFVTSRNVFAMARRALMMFVKLYFRTSDIYLISLVSLDPSGFHLRTK